MKVGVSGRVMSGWAGRQLVYSLSENEKKKVFLSVSLFLDYGDNLSLSVMRFFFFLLYVECVFEGWRQATDSKVARVCSSVLPAFVSCIPEV